MTTQPERIPLDNLTSDQLDQLYADLDAARDRLEHHERTTLPNLHRRIEADADTIRRWRDRAETAETRITTLENGARERSALLEEARDALENTGAHGAHGNDWPRLAPAIDELGARIAELTAGQCTHALAVCEQHHRVPVTGCPYPRCKAAAARTTA
ncbi:hypothetical protein ACIG92_08355 [[Kitasatospora] papulosa]|uniref:hypothetical protein n=1 Tax=[Kitasatospora] papulosa TaxID=1464011 RepID=UPI0037D33718